MVRQFMQSVSARPELQASLRNGLLAFCHGRSAVFKLESFAAPAIELLFTRKRPHLPTDNPELFKAAHESINQLLRDDVDRIISGVYPVEVLKPGSPVAHLRRMPEMLREAIDIARRREEKKSKHFSKEAEELFTDVPEYYQRNFHFQADGYLSEKSARLYDHQVDILFGGAADAMRRLIVVALKERFGRDHDGEGLTFCEVGAGTGRATLFVRLAFPKAKIVALDLSAPYLKLAQKNLRKFPRHDFVEADGAHVPFREESVDAIFSVFLFHELPNKERVKVVKESLRLLKPGGFIGMVDSLQTGDIPKFDEALERFPVDFHEPFYRDYTLHPIEAVFADAGVLETKTETGFLAKCVSGHKA